ncbi:hypothetical protein [Marinobacter sp.]|uniref:hypothetical protein n=1 Tax=Marinobacter sp. TaxID=50741 RepID=UPI00384DE005
MSHLHPLARLSGFLLLLLLAGCSRSGHGAEPLELTLNKAQLEQVGQKIYQNECAANSACLVHWNKGEAFPSLGIGHFIWYPRGVAGRFTESFPALIEFMKEQRVELPPWLAALDPLDAPWPDRDALHAARGSPQVKSLRQFLERTQGLQAAFIFRRAKASLSRVMEAAPAHERPGIRHRLTALSKTPGGVYALIDYVNFKGEGLSPTETYEGEGWGLLQVLQQMSDSSASSELGRFREAAAHVLTRRAHNARADIERQQWLAGWLKRLETYREPG